MDHADVPSAVFSHPPVSTVGLTEPQAREKHGALDIYRSIFRPLKHTLSGRDEKTMMKLIVAQDSRSEEHTSELQSLMRISYAVFCLKKKTKQQIKHRRQLRNNCR